MQKLLKILADTRIQGLLAVVAILATFVGLYYAGQDVVWLYLAVLAVFLTVAFVVGAELQQRGSAVTKLSIYLISAAGLLAAGYGLSRVLLNAEDSLPGNIPPIAIPTTKTGTLISTEIVTVTVWANEEWQPTNVKIEEGRRVTFRVVDGAWSAVGIQSTSLDNGTGSKLWHKFAVTL